MNTNLVLFGRRSRLYRARTIAGRLAQGAGFGAGTGSSDAERGGSVA